jgi:hypothetical protein
MASWFEGLMDTRPLLKCEKKWRQLLDSCCALIIATRFSPRRFVRKSSMRDGVGLRRLERMTEKAPLSPHVTPGSMRPEKHPAKEEGTNLTETVHDGPIIGNREASFS